MRSWTPMATKSRATGITQATAMNGARLGSGWSVATADMLPGPSRAASGGRRCCCLQNELPRLADLEAPPQHPPAHAAEEEAEDQKGDERDSDHDDDGGPDDGERRAEAVDRAGGQVPQGQGVERAALLGARDGYDVAVRVRKWTTRPSMRSMITVLCWAMGPYWALAA